jgi:hypothetical protein
MEKTLLVQTVWISPKKVIIQPKDHIEQEGTVYNKFIYILHIYVLLRQAPGANAMKLFESVINKC